VTYCSICSGVAAVHRLQPNPSVDLLGTGDLSGADLGGSEVRLSALFLSGVTITLPTESR
jgi:hypothetical protein